jgi:hypothetical protein
VTPAGLSIIDIAADISVSELRDLSGVSLLDGRA